jgi:hypothetical protein
MMLAPVARVKDFLTQVGAGIYDGYFFGVSQPVIDRLKAQ